MQRAILLACSIFAGLSATNVLAADGSSGCGPGWYVFKENSMVSSLLRSTTNYSLAPAVTLGMTFGTSNCAQHKLVETHKESLRFAELAYHELTVSLATGQGEHLAAFASTLGCTSEVQPRFNATMQQAYPRLLPTSLTSPADLLQNVLSEISSDPQLALACNTGLS